MSGSTTTRHPHAAWPQYLIYAGLSLAVVALTAVGASREGTLFSRFTESPIVVSAAAAVLGAALLTVLRFDGYAIFEWEGGQGITRAAGIAALFGALIIAADFAVPLPAEINVAFPNSLLFYPVAAFGAEVVFRVSLTFAVQGCFELF